MKDKSCKHNDILQLFYLFFESVQKLVIFPFYSSLAILHPLVVTSTFNPKIIKSIMYKSFP